MFPDFGADPCLWVLANTGTANGAWIEPALWVDAPLSRDLRDELADWRVRYETECYENGDRWPSRRAYETWASDGWRLWAHVNLELIPQGWVVRPNFAHFPEPGPRAPTRPAWRRRRRRRGRQPWASRYEAARTRQRAEALLR